MYQQYSNYYYTKQLPVISIPNNYSIDYSKIESNPSAPRLENFDTQTIDPPLNIIPTVNMYTRNSTIETKVPINTVLVRNKWETFNTTNGKAFGGFDKFNVYNIPSTKIKNSQYMTLSDLTNPFNTSVVYNTFYKPVQYDLHSS